MGYHHKEFLKDEKKKANRKYEMESWGKEKAPCPIDLNSVLMHMLKDYRNAAAIKPIYNLYVSQDLHNQIKGSNIKYPKEFLNLGYSVEGSCKGISWRFE